MSWSNTQKQLFARACQGAGLDDDMRRLILGQCEGRAVHGGRITSTSPRLTQRDFEHCMAVVERSSPNDQVQIKRGGALRFPPGHWQQQATDEGERKRLIHLAYQLAKGISAAMESWPAADEALVGWIQTRINQHRSSVEELPRRELTDLVHGLKAYARRHKIDAA